MADEKKKPDLRSRLKGTMAGVAPPTSPSDPGIAAPSALVGDVASPVDIAPAAPSMSGGDDIAVPDFIRQQMAEKAAAEARAIADRVAAERAAAERARVAAAAADPFSSGNYNAGPQEVRLVIDDKAVSDAEVGRKNTGPLVAGVVVGVVSLAAGYLIGDFKSSKTEESKTRAAITDIRRSVDTTGTVISALKDNIERAVTAAGIQGNDDAQPAQAQAAPAAATVDEGLTTWFATQSPDPPLAPDVYAGRVGRLRPDLVLKLMKVQVALEQVWRDLQRHQALTTAANLAIVRNSLSEAQRTRTEFQRLAVIFSPGRGEGAPPVVATLVQPTFDQTGGFTYTPAVPGAPRRTVYSAGDLAEAATIGTVGIPVAPGGGAAGMVVSHLGRPWSDYLGRLRSLKTRVDALQQDHHSLGEALSRAGVN